VALDAVDHDRVMAAVSHLPHVVANVLAGQAVRALEPGPAVGGPPTRLPRIGPSFRDATRVAGAHPALWREIYAANADALVAALDDAVARL
jgi:prephenate dehydrogenase